MSICKLISTNCQKKNIGTTLFEARKMNFLRTNSIQLHPTPCFLSNQTWHDPRRSSRKHRDLSGWPVVHGPSAKASLVGGPGPTSPVTKRKRRHFLPFGSCGGGATLYGFRKKRDWSKNKPGKKQDGYIEKEMCSFFCCRENEDGWFLLRFVQVDKNFRCISGFLRNVLLFFAKMSDRRRLVCWIGKWLKAWGLFTLKQHPSGPRWSKCRRSLTLSHFGSKLVQSVNNLMKTKDGKSRWRSPLPKFVYSKEP